MHFVIGRFISLQVKQNPTVVKRLKVEDLKTEEPLALA